MQECINSEVVESCNRRNNSNDDDDNDGDIVEGNYTSQCEPIADSEHVEEKEKPVLYIEMEEHDAPYIRAIPSKKEFISMIMSKDSSSITVETDKLHSNLCEEEGGTYRTECYRVESRPHYNIPYVSLVEHKWRNQTIKWKLPVSECEHERKELQSFLIHKSKKTGPMIAAERHLASFSLCELSHKKPNNEPMEITKWSQVTLPEEWHTASTEPTNMFVPKQNKERHVTYNEHKAGKEVEKEQHVLSATKEFANMTIMKQEAGCTRDANYCNENNSNKVTVSRISNYRSTNINHQGVSAGHTDNTKQTKLLTTSNTNTHTTITATKEHAITHKCTNLHNYTNTKKKNQECSTFGDVMTHNRETVENVQLHIYDLSKGVMSKYSKLALGEFSPAIYHSGVVCFGKEFIFEGGIAMWRAGQTRFGNKFAVVNAGHTTKSLKEFLEWTQERELSVYQLSDYDVARHNCHHFTRSAVHFLTNNRSTVPSYLFNTIEVIRRSIIGAAMLEVVSLLTCSFQYIASKQQHSRLIERLIACDVLTNASVVCEVNTLPPCMCILFRLSERVSLLSTFEAMEPYIEHLIKRRKISNRAKIMYNCFVKRLLASTDDPTITSMHMESEKYEEQKSLPSGTTEFALLSNFVDMIVKVLMENDETVWGPVLNVLRVAILDLNVCVECTSHRWLIPLLLHAASHFTRLVPIVKLALLRVLCNLVSFGHGAIILRDEQYVSVWISAVGMALCDHSPAIVYSAACLSLNITMALITVSVQSLRNEIKHYSSAHKLALASTSSNNTALNNNNTTTIFNSASYKESTHPIYRLITIILYQLRKTKANQMHEASRNMLLHSLMRLMSANGSLLNFTVHHTLQVKCDELISVSSTNDSGALLCIIKALHILHRK